MAISWYQKAGEYKSPWPVVAAFLLRSRETRVRQNRELTDENERLRSQLERQQRQIDEQQRELDSLQGQRDELGRQLDLAKRSVNLPQDPPMGTHGDGARMVSLAVNLARSVGLRGASRVLGIFLSGSVWIRSFRREHRFATGFSDWELAG